MTTESLPAGVTEPPDWLGTRPLPVTDAGFGEVQPTPPALVDRRFTTEDVLVPPEDGEFAATIEPVPEEVAARSTWHEGCPVTLDDLRYVSVSFRGFDQRPHTGELIIGPSMRRRSWGLRDPVGHALPDRGDADHLCR